MILTLKHVAKYGVDSTYLKWEEKKHIHAILNADFILIIFSYMFNNPYGVQPTITTQEYVWVWVSNGFWF